MAAAARPYWSDHLLKYIYRLKECIFLVVFAILFLTLPTQPNAVRLRVWRALKALGCASIRDGTYLLPHHHAGLFDPLVEEVRANGGQASVMQLCPSDDAQGAELRALFDRSESYGAWRTESDAFAASLAALGEVECARRPNFDHPCRLNIDQGWKPVSAEAGCG